MKKIYVAPIFVIERIESQDIIAASDREVKSEVTGGPTWGGGGGGPAGPPEAKEGHISWNCWDDDLDDDF